MNKYLYVYLFIYKIYWTSFGDIPKVISFSAAISACEKCGRWLHAMQLLDDLMELREELDVILLGAVVSACGAAGQWQCALALLEEMQRNEIRGLLFIFFAGYL